MSCRLVGQIERIHSLYLAPVRDRVDVSRICVAVFVCQPPRGHGGDQQAVSAVSTALHGALPPVVYNILVSPLTDAVVDPLTADSTTERLVLTYNTVTNRVQRNVAPIIDHSDAVYILTVPCESGAVIPYVYSKYHSCSSHRPVGNTVQPVMTTPVYVSTGADVDDINRRLIELSARDTMAHGEARVVPIYRKQRDVMAE